MYDIISMGIGPASNNLSVGRMRKNVKKMKLLLGKVVILSVCY